MSVYSDKGLFEYLKELEIIDLKKLTEIFELSQEQKTSLINSIVESDLVSDLNLGQIIADYLKLPFVNLSEQAIPDQVLNFLPEVFCKSQNIIAFKEDDKIHLATSLPENSQTLSLIKKKTDKPIKLYYTTGRLLAKAQSLYNKKINLAFEEIIKKSTPQKASDTSSEPPVVEIVDTIIKYANQYGASDIHIEPLKDKTLVRFRVDGMLTDIVSLPLELLPQIVSRVKVMSDLRTDEHSKPQDGKIVFLSVDDKKHDELDIRVSIVPTTKGETIVMRLLSEKSRQFSLVDLGFSAQDLHVIEKSYKMPHGMILSTGPTGSGKTTTLYSILKLINRREINIMTIEDPVEYQIDNINQIQVNTKTDLTFANGLRSIVRQDPDVILVGEIRDKETAAIAVNSSMTGHLVLSTLHTNDAITAFPRLVDMGVEPYLIASTVNVVVGQRLVRKICSKCRVSIEVEYKNLDGQIQKKLKKNQPLRCYMGKGCDVCHNTGYSGRVGIFEVLEMTEELGKAITDKKNVDEIKKIATKSNFRTMIDDGFEKIKQGITSIEEVLRVTME